MRRWATLAVGLAALFAMEIVAPRGADARMQATLEFGPGVSIPLTRYIDVSGHGGHNRIDNGVHASLGLALLFGNWSFRYSVNWISLGKQSVSLPQSVYAQYQQIAATIDQVPALRQIFEIPALPQAGVTGDLGETLAFHSVAFGYRFYFLRGRWQPYVPLELGAAIVSSDVLSRTIYGLSASTGIGLDVRIWRFLYLGAAVRYNFYLTETDQGLALLGLAATSDIFGSSVAMGHLLSVTAQLQARY